MYDKEKIINNHLRASNTKNKKVILFFYKLFEEVIDRLNIEKNKNYKILELCAKNKFLDDLLMKEKIENVIHKTVLSSHLNNLCENVVLHSNDLSNIKEKNFDFCISLFPIVTQKDLSKLLLSSHRILSNEGRFIFIFHSIDSCVKIKSFIENFFQLENEHSFLPCFDILSLGNFANSTGFKNILADKSKYIISSNTVTEILKFTRDLGESNYILNKKTNYINKNQYKIFKDTLHNKLIKNKKIINEISVNFLTGKKSN